MDNDEARVRHGVKPTYKRVKGFQPLQMTWQKHIIDAVFRRGDAHSNNGNTVEQMVRHVMARIRKPNRADVAIIVRMDSELFDQKLFEAFEDLSIGDICGGKLYEPIKEFVAQSQRNQAAWGRDGQGNHVWHYLELGTRCGQWTSFCRALFCRPLYQDAQMVLPFCPARHGGGHQPGHGTGHRCSAHQGWMRSMASRARDPRRLPRPGQ
ncbi:transposase [Desulfosoma caldarium]|uniref:transposase n=1 Tax=Desulfosoma caldarium TaxID=610254 RepID=UPI001475E048|nr:transposase [Desulfosoma caldarium]